MNAATYTTLPGLRVTRKGGHEMELFAGPASGKLRNFQRIFHEASYGAMDFHYFIGDGFQLWRSHYSMLEHLQVCSQGDVALLELHIPLGGETMSWWDGQQENRLRPCQFALDYVPYINSDTLFAAGCGCDTLDIHYDRSFLEAFAPRFPVLQTFLHAVDQRRRAQLLQRAVRFLSPQMMAVVRDILQYPGQREMAAQYYQEHVSVLLEMVLERALQINPDYSAKKYLDAAMSVRQLIERHPATIFTGKALSAYTGINVSLLHKIFREYNGTSLFAFGEGIRLDHGRALLRDTSLYISEIALECGYPEHANFTAAFRRRFGFTPQQYRAALANKNTHS